MQAFSLARMNIRHNSILHIALSAAVLLLTPVLFGIAELDALAAAVPLEMFVALIGIILLTPVFQPEHTPGTEELVAAKYVGCGIIYAIRVLYSLGILMLLILLFSVYAVFPRRWSAARLRMQSFWAGWEWRQRSWSKTRRRLI